MPSAPPVNRANTKNEIAVPRASGAISVPRVWSTEWQIGKPAPIRTTPGTTSGQPGATAATRKPAAIVSPPPSSISRSPTRASSRPTNLVAVTAATASTASTAPVQA